MEHAFTNDPQRLADARTWRDAAIADGWTAEPTYKSFGSESMESHATLRRGGFVAHAMCRTIDKVKQPWSKWLYEAQISVWGPDGKAIIPPAAYNWSALVAGLRHCKPCGADDVETFRYSFAGRCCEACLPKMRAQYEWPGWDA